MQHTAKMLVFVKPRRDPGVGEDRFEVKLLSEETRWYAGEDWIKICETEVHCSVEIPSDDELLLKLIRTLEEKQSNVLAQAQQEYNRIQQKIDELKLITYVPAESGAVSIEPASDPNDDIPL